MSGSLGLYTFTKPINDPLALQAHIHTYVGSPFDYLTYNAVSNLVTVYTTESTFSSTTNTLLTNALANFSNPTSPNRALLRKTNSINFLTQVDNVTLQTTSNTLSVKSVPVANGGTGLSTVPSTLIPFGANTNPLVTDASFSYVTASKLLTTGSLRLTNTTNSNSSTTGAAIVTGGVGIGGDLNVAGTASFGNMLSVVVPGTATSLLASMYQPALTAGASSYNTMRWGVASSTNNSITMAFNYRASGSATNSIALGLYGSDKIQLYGDGKLVVEATLPSTTSGTGAFVVVGGAGIGGSLNVGGNATVAGTLVVTGAVTVPEPISGSNASTKNYVDSLVSTAGSGLTKTGNVFSVNADQTGVTSLGTLTGLTSSGIVSITNATDSTSTTSGALTVAGGIGVVGSVFADSVNSTSVSVINPTTGSGSILGSFLQPNLTAGAAVWNTLRWGVSNANNNSASFVFNYKGSGSSTNYVEFGLTGANKLQVFGTGVVKVESSIASTTSGSGALVVVGGVGIGGTLSLGGNVNYVGTTTVSGNASYSGITSITNTTASTSTTSGALVVSGGFGLTGASYFGGIANFTNTTNATSTTTGALILAGGAGMLGSLYVGNTSNFTGRTTHVDGITVSLVTASTSASTGSIFTAGGIGAGAASYFGSTITSPSNVLLTGGSSLLSFTAGTQSLPTFTTRSAGTRISLRNELSASATEYALGISTLTFWSSIPTSTASFAWYAGTSPLATLSGVGDMTVIGSLVVNKNFTQTNNFMHRWLDTAGSAFMMGISLDNTFFLSGTTSTGVPTTIFSLPARTDIPLVTTPVPWSFGGTLRITDTSPTTSAITGSISTLGGISAGGSAWVQGTLTSGSILIGNMSTASNQLVMDCKGSTTLPAEIVFINSGGTGDFGIRGDGGDFFWIGGGNRALQMGAYHGLILQGGRTTGSMTQINGSGASFNTLISNTNNSVGLIVRGVGSQSQDLTQWQSSSSATLAKIDASGMSWSRGTRLTGTDNSYVGLSATTGSANYTLTLPSSAPTVNTFLLSDASGNLNWRPQEISDYFYTPFAPTSSSSQVPVLASGNDQGYVVTESNFLAGSGGAFRLFDSQTTTRWITDNAKYTSTGVPAAGSPTTLVGATTYTGEWMQISMPRAVTLTSFTMTAFSQFATRHPAQFVLATMTNTGTWVALFTQTTTLTWALNETKTFSFTTNIVGGSIYRLIVTRVGNTPDSGVMHVSKMALNGIWNEVRTMSNVKMISVNVVTASTGLATVYLTSDGTSNGPALFTTILSIQVVALRDTTTAVQMVFASIKTISGDNKTLVVNAVTGSNIAIGGGASLVTAPIGTVLSVFVVGI